MHSIMAKALTKYERTKMKREAQQKCSLFSEKSIFVGHRISLGLYYICTLCKMVFLNHFKVEKLLITYSMNNIKVR